MFSKALAAAAAVALTASTASAQTFSMCDPLKKDGCPPNPAFGRTFTCPLTQDDCGAFETADGTSIKYDKDMGAVFTITKDGEAPTIHTKDYVLFGRVDVFVRAATGRGIVTSTVLQSDDLDEIDWEWIGGDNAQVQTNWFSKGQAGNFDRNQLHPVTNPTGAFRNYSIEWTSTQVTWFIDGVRQRTLTDAEAKAKGFALPQTPMKVRLGTWVAGGKNNEKGTSDWAGGPTDFSQAPFIGYYKSLTIVDYAGKDRPANGSVEQYVYGDKTGSYTSIKVIEGDRGDDTSTSSVSASASSGSKNSSSTTASISGDIKTSDNETASESEISTPTTLMPGNNSTATSPSATRSGTGTGPYGASGSSSPSSVPASSAAHGTAVLGSVLLAAAVGMAQLLL